jgi:hypothetical protein
MSAKYCIFGPLNSHLLNLQLCYFLIFLVSFCILVFCRSWRENCSFKVKNANFGSQNRIGLNFRFCTSHNILTITFSSSIGLT